MPRGGGDSRRFALSLLIAGVCASALASTSGVASAATAPVAAYGFEEASGATVTDASANANAGTITGATRVNGRFGRALSFLGSGDLVRVRDSASLDLTTGMTLEAWVNPGSGSGYQTIVMKERPIDLSYVLYAAAPAPPACRSRPAWRYQPPTPRPRAPRLVAPRRDVRRRDAAVVRQRSPGGAQGRTPGTMFVSTGDLLIGGNSVWGEFFTGLIDELRVYDRPLTAAEIQADMAAPVVPGSQPPQGQPGPTPGHRR